MFFATWTDRRDGGFEEIWGASLGCSSDISPAGLIASTD